VQLNDERDRLRMSRKWWDASYERNRSLSCSSSCIATHQPYTIISLGYDDSVTVRAAVLRRV